MIRNNIQRHFRDAAVLPLSLFITIPAIVQAVRQRCLLLREQSP